MEDILRTIVYLTVFVTVLFGYIYLLAYLCNKYHYRGSIVGLVLHLIIMIVFVLYLYLT